jgi:isocitrate dehydrogenase
MISGVTARSARAMSTARPTIVYTKVDEAPALATYSLLPIIKTFVKSSGFDLVSSDISLAGRVIASFPEKLTAAQKQSDALAELGELCKTPEANVIKLPNISASIPQLQACIAELQEHGYDIPNYPGTPEDDARYAKVLGSAVNPVLREGNSDRRVAGPVKKFAMTNPKMLGKWESTSGSHVSHMSDGDFFSSEQSASMAKAGHVKITHTAADGTVTVLKEKTELQEGEVIDASRMSANKLQGFFAEQIDDAKAKGLLFSLHLKATMMKVSDPIMFGHCVKVFYKDALEKHADTLASVGANPNNGIGDIYAKIASLPEATQKEIEADLEACYANRPDLAMVDSSKGITNLHVPSDVIIDASMPNVVRDSGMMWNKDDKLAATKAVIPDRCYATMYAAMIEDCKANGEFDPSTMGNVANVGLMAQKAEEYGSHDKTFEIPSDGKVQVTDQDGAVVFEHDVETGDIWRMAQTKDAPIADWVKLAVNRARATGDQTIFWLDENRAHDRTLIAKIDEYLPQHDTSGLDISIMPPVKAIQASMANARKGANTISVTGNVLRDYLTDLFPILELGTSAKMLSIVPLLAGGGLFETGAGGSAPKHVQQFNKEGHLRWDSLGEFLALGVSIEDLATKTNNDKALVVAECLNEAVGKILELDQSPKRKVHQLDNRGSHFYLAMHWAEALANQTKNSELQAEFSTLAQTLKDNEGKIIDELNAAQGASVDVGGYFHPCDDLASKAMRPSATFNAAIDA